ncbi:MAG: glutathione S-transferase N-terminal domain-containing protein [Acetobacteraceae bacterium]|nr:glutathione S-transferase N-terminal domain-containing protein [Acetobacteraceae bacterium]
MKLFYSPASPYVRKVMACAIARGIDGRIARLTSGTSEYQAGLQLANPLSKVPCLITDDGLSLFDSPVICEFLDTIGDALPMFPVSGGARWRALKQQAMGDGMMDACLIRRGEAGKPMDAGREDLHAKQAAKVARSLDALEIYLPHKVVDIGSITIVAALGYLDFRFAAEPWRPGHPILAAWYDEMMKDRCLAETAPPPV